MDAAALQGLAADVRTCVELLRERETYIQELKEERDAMRQCLAAAGIPTEMVAARLHAARFRRSLAAQPLDTAVALPELLEMPEALVGVGGFAGLEAVRGTVARLARSTSHDPS